MENSILVLDFSSNIDFKEIILKEAFSLNLESKPHELLEYTYYITGSHEAIFNLGKFIGENGIENIVSNTF